MLNIREKVFETNSSSVHSLIIFHEFDSDILSDFVYNGAYRVNGSYYGRSNTRILSDTLDKLNYIWTAIISLYCKYDFDNQTIIIKKEFYDWRDKLQAIAPNVNFVIPDSNNYLNIGIDHCQNLIEFFEECKQNIQILKNLIIEDNSFIIVEGDEYGMLIPFIYSDYYKNENKLIPIKSCCYIYVKGN